MDKKARNRLRLLRKRKGFTQKDLAYKLNMTQASYSYLENKAKTIKPETLREICKILDCQASEIMLNDQGGEKNATTEIIQIVLSLSEEGKNLIAKIAQVIFENETKT